ncbi:hypothetical protein VDF13_06835 [Xanthomonas campestris pv. raphani]|uniref:hypothetical protein n=1 Tax=Xanthomonas campestris TaxID=339 RepID=UPI001E2A1F2E|nr:hypothetical protein [Xanthomonas campestris]MCC8488130.1 hypothetical protein [Xanthomonas campestris]MEA9649886.1 hypothetical protein [Xanthomonas campestris pv. raphani]MEA9743453.1 hypothetical protein [Xanthomonas campestris pv. raphani]MEA9767061.1 hypothetical protein [Xanthomonas campestris pv. raphani]MEA9868309.1 hypothetical protein [Xanthomonas campestris pv. raphani]
MSEIQNQLNEIYEIIHNATQEKAQARSSFVPNWMTAVERISLISFVILILTLVIIIIFSKIFPSSAPPLKSPALVIYFSFAVSGLIYMISAVAGIFIDAYRQKIFFGKHGSIMNRVQRYIQDDYEIVLKLKCYPKHLLEYVLMQYQTTWNVMNGRTALIIGDLMKLGLLPALAAAALTASKLLKDEANSFLWIPLAMLSAMYVLAFVAIASRERVSYVTSLLSLAVLQSKDDANQGDR